MPYLEFLNRWLYTPQCIFFSLKTFLWSLHMIPASELPYRRAQRRKPPSSAASAVSPWGMRSLHSEKMRESLLFILAWNCCRSTLDSRADTLRVLHCGQAAPESEPIVPLEVSVPSPATSFCLIWSPKQRVFTECSLCAEDVSLCSVWLPFCHWDDICDVGGILMSFKPKPTLLHLKT